MRLAEDPRLQKSHSKPNPVASKNEVLGFYDSTEAHRYIIGSRKLQHFRNSHQPFLGHSRQQREFSMGLEERVNAIINSEI